MVLIILDTLTNRAHIISGMKFLVKAPSCPVAAAAGRMVNGVIQSVQSCMEGGPFSILL